MPVERAWPRASGFAREAKVPNRTGRMEAWAWPRIARGRLVVMFVSERTGDDPEGYARRRRSDGRARRAAARLSRHRQRLGRTGCGITVSYWADEASAVAWRQHPEHAAIARGGARALVQLVQARTSPTISRSYRWARAMKVRGFDRTFALAVHGDADDRGGEHRAAIGAARARALAGRGRQRGGGGVLGIGAAVGDRRALLGEPVGPARAARDGAARAWRASPCRCCCAACSCAPGSTACWRRSATFIAFIVGRVIYGASARPRRRRCRRWSRGATTREERTGR